MREMSYYTLLADSIYNEDELDEVDRNITFNGDIHKDVNGDNADDLKSLSNGMMNGVKEVTDWHSENPLLYTQDDLDEIINAREKAWQEKFDDLEKRLENEVSTRELLEQDFRSENKILEQENKDMKMVVTEYEQTIMELTERSRNSPVIDEDAIEETYRAKEQLNQDLNAAETNLVDAYKRIEKLKMALDNYKANEENLQDTLGEFQTKLQKSEEKYNRLKQHATEKIDFANTEIARVRKQKEIDLAGIQASLKKSQARVTNLEAEVAQKVQENKDLTDICDELIKKVSGD